MTTAPSVVDNVENGILGQAEELLQKWRPVIESIPDAGGDGELGIVLAILGAKSPEEIDAPWNSNGLLDHVDKPLTIRAIRKGRSEFSDGFGFFLLLDTIAEDGTTGPTLTTGSVSVVAQLMALHAMKAFPITVIPRMAERPSARGYHPVHLELVRG
jgi:hypothetical protein